MLQNKSEERTMETILYETETSNTVDLSTGDEIDRDLTRLIDKLIEENNQLKEKLNGKEKYEKVLFEVIKAKNLKSATKKVVELKKKEANTGLLLEEVIQKLECGKPSNIISSIDKLKSKKHDYYTNLEEIVNICGVDNYHNAKKKIEKLVSDSNSNNINIPDYISLLKPSWMEGKKESEIRSMKLASKSIYSIVIGKGIENEKIHKIHDDSLTHDDFLLGLRKISEPEFYQQELKKEQERELREEYRQSHQWIFRDSGIDKILYLQFQPPFDMEIKWSRIVDFQKSYFSEEVQALKGFHYRRDLEKEDFILLRKFHENFELCFPEIELIWDEVYCNWEYYENHKKEKAFTDGC